MFGGRNTRRLLKTSPSSEKKRKRKVLELVAALKQCTKARDLQSGKKLHQEAADAGWDTSNKYVSAALITLYSQCRQPALARQVFDKTPALHRDAFTWTNIILGYANNGLHAHAMDLFATMDCQPTEVTYVAALKACAGLASSCGDNVDERTSLLAKGSAIHREVTARGYDSNVVLANTLVDMYCKCGSMKLAKEVFDGSTRIGRNAVTWTCLVLGYVENGQSGTAIEMFEKMDCQPDSVSYVAVLKACSALAGEKESSVEKRSVWLEKGKDFHRQLRERGFESSTVVGNTLIDMYGKFGLMNLARQVFDKMARRDVVTWTCLILGYMENGESCQALEVFEQMDCEPDLCSYIAALKSCAALASEEVSKKEHCLAKGTFIHEELKVRRVSVEQDMLLATALLDMYGKCGCLSRAKDVFDGMVRKDVVAWTCLMQGYVENGESDKALKLFHCMDCQPNPFAVASALKACGGLASGSSVKEMCLEKGMEIHRLAREQGFDESDVVVGAALVDMYSKCGRMSLARDAFDRMPLKNSVAWSCLTLGYVENGEFSAALDVFESMDCAPSSFTYVGALKACGGLADADSQSALDKGREIHEQVKKHELAANTFVANTLVEMYAKCNSMSEAEEVFNSMKIRNVVAWNCLIMGYVKNGQSTRALDLFTEMEKVEIPQRDPLSYVIALKACGALAELTKNVKFSLEKGVSLHRELVDLGFESHLAVLNALMDMYTKCGDMKRCVELFMATDCEPDVTSYATVLKACGGLGLFAVGQAIHAAVCKLGLEEDSFVESALISLHTKCGSIAAAEVLFYSSSGSNLRHIVPWNALMAGYGSTGDFHRVFELANKIREAGLRMDHVTAISILTACSHAGKVEEGRRYFDVDMPREGITPTLEHYNCVVDLFGRANRFDEAMKVIRNMESDKVSWMTLLGACRKWKNLEIAKVAFDELVARGECPPAAYVLMSDIYGGLSMWEQREQMDLKRKEEKAWKVAGQTIWCDEKGRLREFVVGEKLEEEAERKLLQALSGYESDEKYMDAVCGHSEKLAIAHALVHGNPDKKIRLVKNLRICIDCHNATRHISKVTKRQIILRDSNRVHVFDDGECSCRDYW